MSENKTARYFKYAIGEIVLVVIGILIALQINNWNESRKQKQEEIEVLKEIKNSLISDLNYEFPSIKKRAISRKNLCINLLQTIKNGGNISDSINFVFIAGGGTFRPNYTAYKGLESKGIDIIQNDSIKNGILRVYNSTYVHLKMRIEVNDFANLRDFNRPFLYNNFKLNENNIYVPIDANALLRSEKFKIILDKLKGSDQTTINQLSNLEIKIKKIIAIIDKEVEKYK